MTQKQVADEIGISQSYISRLEKRIIKSIRRNLEKNMLTKKTGEHAKCSPVFYVIWDNFVFTAV